MLMIPGSLTGSLVGVLIAELYQRSNWKMRVGHKLGLEYKGNLGYINYISEFEHCTGTKTVYIATF